MHCVQETKNVSKADLKKVKERKKIKTKKN